MGALCGGFARSKQRHAETASRRASRKPMPTSGQILMSMDAILFDRRKRTGALFVCLLLSLIYTSGAMQAPIELDGGEDSMASHELQGHCDALQMKHNTLQHKYNVLLHELPRWMKRKIRGKAEATE